MNDLVFFSLIIFVVIRVIGLGVSIDFFYDSKDQKFLYFIFCWFFWIIANIFPIIADKVGKNSLREFYLILNVMCALVGFVFYTWGFFKYYILVSYKLFIVFTMISIIVPLLVYLLIGFTIALYFSLILLYIFLSSSYIIPPLKRKRFIKYMGKSIRWYYAALLFFLGFFPISIITFLEGYNYGLYYAEDILFIILYYTPSISSTVILIILLVHLEYNISTRKKLELKDNYSHNLGNIMQAIQSSSDLINLSESLSTKNQSSLEMIQKKCNEASKLIKKIRKL